MNVETFEMPRAEALQQWRNYNQALKTHSDRYLKDMRSMYNQLKSGRKLIDVFAALKTAGLNEREEPRLAICPADAKVCSFRKLRPDQGRFTDQADGRWHPPKARTLQLPAETYAAWTMADQFTIANEYLTCSVPMVPAQFVPEGRLADYWLLWEVDYWRPDPPRDPMLLRRLTPNMFVVLAVWNLTPLERAVIRGRV